MLRGYQIIELVDFLTSHYISIYHACQLKDLHSYFRIGGIPSRNLLTRSDLPYTAFDTDENDKNNGIWDKVFLNFDDFGTIFSSGRKGVPNPYGPIALMVKPSALMESIDVSVTLRSLGAEDASREQESFKNVGDVKKIFKFFLGPDMEKIGEVSWKSEIIKNFPDIDENKIESPEISCTIAKEIIPLDYISNIIVDPYEIESISLFEFVDALVNKFSLNFPIRQRSENENIQRRYHLLYDQVMLGVVTVGSLEFDNAEMISWVEGIKSNRKIHLQYSRYARYLRSGTIDYAIAHIK